MAELVYDSSLIGHWPFNDGAGTTIAAAAGSGGNGTLVSATGAWGAVCHDGSAVLTQDDGQDNYATFPGVDFETTFTALAAFRISKDQKCWTKINGIIGFSSTVIDSGDGWDFFHGASSDGRLTLFCRGSASRIDRNLLGFQDGWIIAHIWIGGGDMGMMLDDGPDATASCTLNAVAGAQVFTAGRVYHGSLNLRKNGHTADVAMWDRVLTREERLHNFKVMKAKLHGTAPQVIHVDTQWPVTKFAGPSDGVHGKQMNGLMTKPWSTETDLWLPTLVAPNTSVLYQLNKTTKAVVDQVTLRTATYNEQAGHRECQVAVASDGTLIVFPHGFNPDGWLCQHSTSPGDLNTLTATAQPTGAGNSSGVDYKRFYRNPANGDIWLLLQGDSNYGCLYRWNVAGKSWTVIGGPMTQYNGVSYDQGVFFGPDGAVYLLTLHYAGGPGYPKGYAGIIKSVDDGANWTDMRGNAITIPLDKFEQTTIFPMTAVPGSAAINHDCEGVSMTFDSDGNPIVLAAWRNAIEWGEGLGVREVWQAKWDPVAQDFLRHKLVASKSNNCEGFYGSVTRIGNRIHAIYSEYDWVTVEGFDAVAANQDDLTPGTNIYMLVSDDDARSWRRYVLYAADSDPDIWWGCTLDHEAARIDGLLRFCPHSLTAAGTAEEIWEAPSHASPGIENGTLRLAAPRLGMQNIDAGVIA